MKHFFTTEVILNATSSDIAIFVLTGFFFLQTGKQSEWER